MARNRTAREQEDEKIHRILCAVDRLRKAELRAWVREMMTRLPPEEVEKIPIPEREP